MNTAGQDKFVGAMIGSALGDAIGELAFRYRNQTSLLDAISRSPILCYTDDTAMAIGLAQSLVKKGDIDQQHIGETFRLNTGVDRKIELPPFRLKFDS